MKQPQNRKFKKHQKCLTFLKRSSYKEPTLYNGIVGLVSRESTRLTDSQIESMRLGLMRFLKKRGKIWMNVFPHLPVTSKPSETRMGKGKGNVSYYYFPLRKNKVILEIGNIEKDIAIDAIKTIIPKLGIRTKIIEDITKV